MCNTRNLFPFAINWDLLAWCWSLLWLNNYCWMMSASSNHCTKMGPVPGRRFLKQPATTLEPVISIVGCYKKIWRVERAALLSLAQGDTWPRYVTSLQKNKRMSDAKNLFHFLGQELKPFLTQDLRSSSQVTEICQFDVNLTHGSQSTVTSLTAFFLLSHNH